MVFRVLTALLTSARCQRITLFALLLPIAVQFAFAQFNCSIQGIITDPSGAVVADASVQVTNMDTGIKRDANTSSEGLYRVLSLPSVL